MGTIGDDLVLPLLCVSESIVSFGVCVVFSWEVPIPRCSCQSVWTSVLSTSNMMIFAVLSGVGVLPSTVFYSTILLLITSLKINASGTSFRNCFSG